MTQAPQSAEPRGGSPAGIGAGQGPRRGRAQPGPQRPRNGIARGIPLFRIFGIQLRIDWSWLIVFLIMVLALRGYFAHQTLADQPGWAVWALSAVSVIALFACVLAHELGHSLVAMRNGIQMFDITLFIFGGMARLRGEPGSPNAELRIALAGPAVTVVLGAGFWAAWLFLRSQVGPVAAEGLQYLATINTALLIFNMIPGFPLDGGRVLRAILWRIRGDLLSATRTAATVGKGFGILMIVFGALVIVRNGNVVGGIFNIFLGWFLAGAASQSIQHMQIRRVLEFFRVSDAMQRFVVTVPPNMTLDRLIADAFYRYHFNSYPVVADERLAGMVSLQDVQKAPQMQWGCTTVSAVAQPLNEAMVIGPDAGLYDAFQRMGEEDIGRLVVVDGQGRVVGLLSRRDIMRLLQVYSGLARPTAATIRPAIPVADPAEGSEGSEGSEGGEGSARSGPPAGNPVVPSLEASPRPRPVGPSDLGT